MPFVSETALARVQTSLAKTKARAEQKAGEIKDGLEIVGGAALMGFIRGMVEKKNGPGSFTIANSIDIEFLAGTALVGAGMMDLVGKYDNDALMLGFGMLAHYSGQVARKMGETGKFTMVAGGLGGPSPLDALLGDAI